MKSFKNTIRKIAIIYCLFNATVAVIYYQDASAGNFPKVVDALRGLSPLNGFQIFAGMAGYNNYSPPTQFTRYFPLLFAVVALYLHVWPKHRQNLIEVKKRNEALAQQKKPVEKKPVATQSRNLDESNDAQITSPSIEITSHDMVSSIPCASDILKAQSVSFSPRSPGNVFGFSEEMAKVGYRSVGGFYSDIQKIVTHEIEIATVVKKFDLMTDNVCLRLTLTRMLYAASLGTAKPKASDLKPLALALRTIVESQKIVPRANGGLSSLEMAELCSSVVVTAVASCQFGSASALMEHFNNATLQFADETISPDGPSNRRYITALVLCFFAMVIENSKSISIVTDSLAGNRLVPIDINQLGSIDFNYLNANRPGWLADVIANSPELLRAYLRHLRDDE